nr:odorant receptor 19 [Achelura yunnanensis]
MESNKIKPLDAFNMLFRTLTFTAYFMAVPEIENPIKKKWHKYYRIATVLILLIYDLQHIIFVILVFGDVERMIEGLSVLLTILNVTYKLITVNLNEERFQRLHDALEDDIFSAKCLKDEELMTNNKKQLDGVSRTINRTVTVIAVCWLLTPFLKKLADEEVILPAYFPFQTNDWVSFSCASVWITFVIIWVGYGHMTLNILIVGYYSQVKVQLSIVRYHLEHLADDDDEHSSNISTRRYQSFKDYQSDLYQKKLVELIQRYDKAVWFSKEMESITSKAMLVQFSGSTGIVCTVVYKMTGLPLNTAFIYIALYLACLLLELFVYCYYGTLLENESNFVNESVYLCDWTSLSPKFRKQLMIAMIRWSRPITPMAAGLVPLSLNTFIAVLRGSYTMYTILKKS